MSSISSFGRLAVITSAALLLLQSCGSSADHAAYHDNTGRADAWSGGERIISISTPKGEFKVWTKRVGNNPDIKVLLLHGGPGLTHEYLLAFDSFFPGAGIEYYHYDQLGSFGSDQPDDDDLWTIPRFVEEVEQVRQALGLTQDNFYIYGSSWGGILGMEYALKYQHNLKGLIISNMMASIPDYNRYADEVLAERIDPEALAELRAIEAAAADFHARFSASWRRYSYTVSSVALVIGRQYAWQVDHDLDARRLSACAAIVQGSHDFNGFAKAREGSESQVCQVHDSAWERAAEGWVYTIRADHFLHHMVRYLVGTMIEVARGRFSVDQFAAHLAGQTGSLKILRAPAAGLVLEEVAYAGDA